MQIILSLLIDDRLQHLTSEIPDNIYYFGTFITPLDMYFYDSCQTHRAGPILGWTLDDIIYLHTMHVAFILKITYTIFCQTVTCAIAYAPFLSNNYKIEGIMEAITTQQILLQI